MKKLIVTLAAVLVSVSAFAQGTINFNNRSLKNAAGATYNAIINNAVGATAQLWLVDAQGTPTTALTPSTDFRTGAGAGFVNAVLVTVPDIAPGTTGTRVVVRAWSGAASYDAASVKGQSEIVTLAALGGTPTGGLPITPPNLDGLQEFTLVPEPSTIALAALGIAALYIRRRK